MYRNLAEASLALGAPGDALDAIEKAFRMARDHAIDPYLAEVTQVAGRICRDLKAQSSADPALVAHAAALATELETFLATCAASTGVAQ